MLAFVLLWWRQTRTRDATSVDAAWAIAIGALALAAAATGAGHGLQRGLAAAVAGAWSLRLTHHLVVHRMRGHRGEDGRYRALREHWGEPAHLRWLAVYLAQAATALVFAMPFWLLAQHPGRTLEPVQACGLAVVIAAQRLEARADRQLEAHRRDPVQRGRTCRSGLWRFSRHPNYFFEWLTWCGIALVAAPAAGWLAVIQPALMLVLVRFVSGVPFTERQALKSRGEDYRRYQAETNAFVPWWPRTGTGS